MIKGSLLYDTMRENLSIQGEKILELTTKLRAQFPRGEVTEVPDSDPSLPPYSVNVTEDVIAIGFDKGGGPMMTFTTWDEIEEAALWGDVDSILAVDTPAAGNSDDLQDKINTYAEKLKKYTRSYGLLLLFKENTDGFNDTD